MEAQEALTIAEQARDTLIEVEQDAKLSSLILRARNDDRDALEQLIAVANAEEARSAIADSVVQEIVKPTSYVLGAPTAVPWGEYGINPEEDSLMEMESAYWKSRLGHRQAFLEEIWNQSRFDEKEKLAFLASVLESGESISATQTAVRLMNEVANMYSEQVDFLNSFERREELIEWWRIHSTATTTVTD